MQIQYSPQRNDEKIKYSFNNDVITVEYNGQADSFDFTNCPNGRLEEVETILPIKPIISAERVNGELKVVLLYFHGANAAHEELFPKCQEV